MNDQITKLIPTKLQGPKEGLRLLFNVSGGLFLALLLGLDLTKLGMNPAVNLWTAGGLAAVSGLGLVWIANHQHQAERADLEEAASVPPKGLGG